MREKGRRKVWIVDSSMNFGRPKVRIGPSWNKTHLEIILGPLSPSSESAGLTPYQARDKKLNDA